MERRETIWYDYNQIMDNVSWAWRCQGLSAELLPSSCVSPGLEVVLARLVYVVSVATRTILRSCYLFYCTLYIPPEMCSTVLIKVALTAET